MESLCFSYSNDLSTQIPKDGALGHATCSASKVAGSVTGSLVPMEDVGGQLASSTNMVYALRMLSQKYDQGSSGRDVEPISNFQIEIVREFAVWMDGWN